MSKRVSRRDSDVALGDDDDRLFQTLRSISDDFTAHLGESRSKSTELFALPTVSDVSLWIVWFVCVIGTATCYLFCEVHQTSYPTFPLEFVTALGAQLTFVSSFLVYLCGVHQFGRHVYRLYQPFRGGAQFVALQGVGSLCLALCLCVVTTHVKLFDTHHIVRGTYTYCAILSSLGSVLLMASIRWFNPENATGKRTSVMDILTRHPNAETVVSLSLMLSPLVLCGFATRFHGLRTASMWFTLVIHAINDVLIHVIIGGRYTPGYRTCLIQGCFSLTTVQVWLGWGACFASTAADVFFILHPDKITPLWLMAVVFANVLSDGFVLLVLRFTKFQSTTGEVKTPSATLAQYGGAAAVLASVVLGAIDLGVTMRLQTHRDEALAGHQHATAMRIPLVDRHVESSNWTWGDLLQLALFVSKSVATTLPILTQVAGRVLHGSDFMWFNSTISRRYRSFILLQVVGWWFFIISCGFFGLFVLQYAPTIGVIMSLTNVISVACLTFSIQEFTRVKEKEVNRGASDPSHASPQGDGATAAGAATAPPPPHSPSKANDDDETGIFAATRNMNDSFASVLNGILLVSYFLAASGLALRVLLDSVRSNVWEKEDQSSETVLFTVSNICFVLATPFAHWSARQLGMSMFDPFSGGGSYVALQVLGWGTYAVLLLLKTLAVVAWHNRARLAALQRAASTHEGYWFTMFGILDLIPVVLITLSNMVEARRARSLLDRREAVREAIAGVRSIMRNYAERCDNDEERELARVAFRTVVAPAYKTYGIVYTRKDLDLLPGLGIKSKGTETGESDSDESDDAMVPNEERRVRHESVLVIVVLMSCFSAAFYVIAAFTWNIPIVSLSMACFGFVICALSCITTHAGYGLVLKGSKGFKPFMPFRGGVEFIKLQIAGWTCFSVVLLITLTSVVETVETSVPALLIAGVLSIASQVLLLDSIPRFSLQAHSSYFLEHNSEVVVAVLCFVGAITFGNVYAAFKAFVTSSDESINARKIALGRLSQQDLASDDRWVSSKRTRVPFVVALVGVALAVPLVLITLGRTTRQVGLVAKKRKSQPSRADFNRASPAEEPLERDEDLDEDETEKAHHHTRAASPTTALGRYRQLGERGAWWEALSNLLQILLMLTAAILPVTAGYLVYTLSHSVSVRSQETVESVIRLVAVILFVSLVLSLVPYFVRVGVPQFFITLRFTIITWMQYGLAFNIACGILLPAFFFPKMGTITSAVLLFALTLLGNFSKVRLLLRMILSGLIGYRTYQVYMLFRVSGLRATCTAPVIGSYIFDELVLVFWLCYVPTYDGKPYHTGSMRSERAIDFARRYIFSDVVRYFKFKIIVDDESVNMRDPKNQYLFSFHPHGVFPGTALFCSMTEEWKRKVGTNLETNLSTHVASIIFNVPGVRDYNLRLGSISVARRSIEASFARGNSSVIVTGGQAEMLHTQLSNTRMVLVTQHMGFIRLAIKNKVPLVPLLSFAENNLLGLLEFPRIQKITLKILGFPFPFVPFGRFGLPVPFRTPLTLVVGKPVPIPADVDAENPEDVARVSALYFAEVKELFYRRRAEAGYPDMELVLVNDKEERRKKREAAQQKAEEAKEKKRQ